MYAKAGLVMSSFHKKMVAVISILGLLIYITLIESNILSISMNYRKIANIPALLIITAAGYYGLQTEKEKWPKYLWLILYLFEILLIGAFGFFYFIQKNQSLTGLKEVVNGLRNLFISPLPYLVIIYLLEVSRKSITQKDKI